MRILVLGINYYPELIGIGKYTTELSEWFAKKGDVVTVVTSMPYYPNWKVFPAYKGRFWHKEIIKDVEVLRAPLFVPSVVSGWTRILHELSFLSTSLIFWFASLFKKYDAVIIVAPPLILGLLGLGYQMFHRTILIYHVQDLQLDAARDLKLIKSKSLLWLVGKIEKLILRHSDFVSTISEGMKRKIKEKGVNNDKLIELRNWINTEDLRPLPSDMEMLEKLDLGGGKPIVLYSGNLGEKQGLDVIIEVAHRMRDVNIQFLIIGEGAYRKNLEALIEQRHVSNVSMRPLQPVELLPKVLNLATLHLVIQKRAAADLVMPSKLTGILSVGGCALVTATPGTTLYDIVTENRIGIIVEPENAKALEDAIRIALTSDLQPIRERARAYAKVNLDKESIMTKFRSFLLERV